MSKFLYFLFFELMLVWILEIWLQIGNRRPLRPCELQTVCINFNLVGVKKSCLNISKWKLKGKKQTLRFYHWFMSIIIFPGLPYFTYPKTATNFAFLNKNTFATTCRPVYRLKKILPIQRWNLTMFYKYKPWAMVVLKLVTHKSTQVLFKAFLKFSLSSYYFSISYNLWIPILTVITSRTIR